MSDTSPPTGSEDASAKGGQWRLIVGIALAAIFLIVMSLAVASAVIDPREESATHQAPAITLDLRAPGSVEILPADGETISIYKRTRDVWGRARSSETVEGDALLIESSCAHRWIVILGDCQIDYQIRAPASTVVSGAASNGTIHVEGMRASVDLATSNGDVEALDVEGQVGLRTSNGSVVVDNITAQGGVEVSTSNGDVTVTNTNGNLTLDTDNGRIEVSGVQSDEVHATTSNGPVTLTFGSNPELVTVSTDNDDIDIDLPSDAPAYAIELSTSNGSTEVNDIVDDPNAPSRIEATTSNGDITIGQISDQ